MRKLAHDSDQTEPDGQPSLRAGVQYRWPPSHQVEYERLCRFLSASDPSVIAGSADPMKFSRAGMALTPLETCPDVFRIGVGGLARYLEMLLIFWQIVFLQPLRPNVLLR